MAILIYLNAVPQSAAFAEKTSVSVMPFSEYSGVREDLALDRHCQRRDRRARYGFVGNGPVDLDQYLLSGINEAPELKSGTLYLRTIVPN